MTAAATISDTTVPARRALRVAFLTLFLDLIGFSIIFPLFPHMLEHYRAIEAPGSIFTLVCTALENVSVWLHVPDPHWGVLVLFGGVLSSLYSFLQFLFAPMIGALSDRVGRRRVLVFTLSGSLLSYALWIFAGNFNLLVLSRLIGGMVSANISTVTAIIADVTERHERTRGMALIGIAFGLGFVLGPAIGGASAMLDLTRIFPSAVPYGINPFSVPALVAFLLTALNLAQVLFQFPETRVPHPSSAPEPRRKFVNPLALFRTDKFPAVSRSNMTYFVFLLSFSGMEFSLTFLARERLGFTPASNALIFLFIGVVLAGTQGGYVRRFADKIGALRMARRGLLLVIPGLLLIAESAAVRSSRLLFTGLFFLAVGAAHAMPSLTSLTSLYTPPEEQGRVMGVFRALGALARAAGPLVACVIYWRLGPSATYVLGAASIMIPLFLMRNLPSPQTERPLTEPSV